ncbi:related to CTK1 - carboxy-terminal domain (CTD) kinase, alpha subunit [Melanopsichium pennsylvanicum]|uniref:Related to CTK1 - carboxy-terminal domain (CTD) kinase, alpha subunit n=2 Tax=Melanopsichium pennsylvanicum TaxID=63383 RepID=A0AAJ4XQM3_9BASI|nr:related to CTK1-carboxy-terminal domain (CTD) kinase, alpha subunit [Melanopsichium pennsylvanicum 4]SNX86523.1 related to CTK1 - carboxy-terminal domain (CTD) kinase, alpha subunit [Melanopsichium pennsylvanicum]
MPFDRWQHRRNGEGDHNPTRATRDTEFDKYGESSRASQRPLRDSSDSGRHHERSDLSNKSRRLDDKAEPSLDRNQRDTIDSVPTSSRRTEIRRDAALPALTIRGIASTNTESSAGRFKGGDDDRPGRARSPDLFDRLSHRRDDGNSPSSRARPEGSLRSRLEGESSRAETLDPTPNRRSNTKLAPRGQYDDSGRRVNDSIDSGTDRHRARVYVPTSPRKRDAGYRQQRDRSSSPAADRPRYRGSEEQDTRYRDSRSSRTERIRRSISPASASTSRPAWNRSSDRYDDYERCESSQRYSLQDRATATLRSARRGPEAYFDDDRTSSSKAREDDVASDRRRRTPSPTRSDVSTHSRHRYHNQEASQRNARDRASNRDYQRDRPPRWMMNQDSVDTNNSRGSRRDENHETDTLSDDWRKGQQAVHERRRSPPIVDSRRARTPLRNNRPEEASDQGHVLSRKSAVTFDGTRPPTGPRGANTEANQRSIRGGGWQTVRSGSRSDRNGHSASKAEQELRRPKSPTPPPPEPSRAEPGEAYESIHQVGEGTYGQVFKARSERTGALVALKKIRMDAEKDGFPVTAMREIKLLQALRHENVVRLHEMMVTRGSIYMVFEYMEHDLNGILAHPQVKFSEAHLKSLASQLLSGLDYLHRKAVLHRDLKGSNLLLNNQGRLKIADFGLARYYAKRRQGDYTNRVVTLWYRPLELLFGATQYGSEVDMWGAGCIFVELFVKKPVFQSETEIGQVEVITDILGPVTKEDWPDVERLSWWETLNPAAIPKSASLAKGERKDYVKSAFSRFMPDSALQVAAGLLKYDPKKRWSANEALGSKYFVDEPRAEFPAGLLSGLEGEWHEFESRRAKKRGSTHRGTDATAMVPTVTSTTPSLASKAEVLDTQAVSAT